MSRTLERIVAIILIAGAAFYIAIDRRTLEHKLSQSQRMLGHCKHILDMQFDRNDQLNHKLVEEILHHKTTQMEARLGELKEPTK
jgi:hypothetical protein